MTQREGKLPPYTVKSENVQFLFQPKISNVPIKNYFQLYKPNVYYCREHIFH